MRCDVLEVTEPPLVVVEILPATTGSLEVMKRINAYFKNGVKTCWLVNPPQRVITIFGADGSEHTFLPGQQAVDPAIGITADVTAVFS